MLVYLFLIHKYVVLKQIPNTSCFATNPFKITHVSEFSGLYGVKTLDYSIIYNRNVSQITTETGDQSEYQ